MSNPFKIKKLEEFTIKDCESYLVSYPYGEHFIEVKKRLIGFKKGTIKSPEIIVEKTDKLASNPLREKPKKMRHKEDFKRPVNTQHQTSQTYSHSWQHVQSNVQSGSKNLGDTILSWIGLIVVVLIVGTIIIFALDAIMPEGTAKFISKYKYFIYPAGFALVRWLDEKK